VDFASAETLLGIDVALLNFSGVLDGYQRDFHNVYQGLPLLDESDSFRSDKDLARRRAEISKLLSLGKTVVVFVSGPLGWFVATGDKEYSGTGRNRHTTNIVSERRVEHLYPFSLETAAAVSDNLQLTSTAGAFAEFWSQVGHRFSASATLREFPGASTVVIAGTDEPVACVAQVDAGTLILLPGSLAYEDADYYEDVGEDPSFVDPQDVSFLDPLFELIDQLRRRSGDFELPNWSAEYLLPGEADSQGHLKIAEENVEAALTARDKRKEDLVRLRQRKLLFTGTGSALENAVEEALRFLGFKFREVEPGRADQIAVRGRSTVVVEVKGKKKSASERDAAQLEKWVSDFVEKEGKTPKALLVVNAWRAKPLADREADAFPDQMLPFSTKRDHCLVTGAQLLAAWLEAEAKPSKKAEIVRSLLHCVGRYERYPENGGDAVFHRLASTAKEAN
jgi:hypothetical protein